jgi:hypothetical protein
MKLMGLSIKATSSPLDHPACPDPVCFPDPHPVAFPDCSRPPVSDSEADAAHRHCDLLHEPTKSTRRLNVPGPFAAHIKDGQ